MVELKGSYGVQGGLFYKQGPINFKGEINFFDDGKVIGLVENMGVPSRGKELILGVHTNLPPFGNALSFVTLPSARPGLEVDNLVSTGFSQGVFHAMGPSTVSQGISNSYGGFHINELATLPNEVVDRIYASNSSFHDLSRLRSLPVPEIDKFLKGKRTLFDGANNNRLESIATCNGHTGYFMLMNK
ncbi:MAG: hypothetical protein AABW82_01975 [Nanoarchaeota archaeon]